jgi:hypothetical protein
VVWVFGIFYSPMETAFGLGTPDHHNRGMGPYRFDYAARDAALRRRRCGGGARLRGRIGLLLRRRQPTDPERAGAASRSDPERRRAWASRSGRADPSRAVRRTPERAAAERGPSGACPRSIARDDPRATDRRASRCQRAGERSRPHDLHVPRGAKYARSRSANIVLFPGERPRGKSCAPLLHVPGPVLHVLCAARVLSPPTPKPLRGHEPRNDDKRKSEDSPLTYTTGHGTYRTSREGTRRRKARSPSPAL